MIAAVTIIYTALLIVSSQIYLTKRYEIKCSKNRKQIMKEHWKYCLLTSLLIIFVLFLQIQYLYTHETSLLGATLRWTTIIWGTYLVSITDYKEKKIPNQIILVLLAIRLIFLAYEIGTNYEFWTLAIGQLLLGAVIGAGVLLAAMIISRKGMGVGDVKLFFVIGAYVGSSKILTTMFYTFFCSAIIGIVLLVSRKAKIKDTMPMAPFAMAGVMIEYWLLTLGG